MTNYYNEIDPYAAKWLRNLIAAGSIPAGDVDDRSIVDVRPGDLAGYSQCHFFAGIGGWALALRLAGWAEDRAIWTGSCPCQPFSNAGKGAGTNDPRHLWPDFFRLIRAGRPPVVMGEQVAGSAGYGWLDGVRSDLAGESYASRGVDIPACAVDAPHIRNRLYWVAVANDGRGRTHAGGPVKGAGARHHGDTGQAPGPHGGGDVADACGLGPSGGPLKPFWNYVNGTTTGWDQGAGRIAGGDEVGVALGDASGLGRGEGRTKPDVLGGRPAPPGADVRQSFWSGAEWLACHDGKARRTKPGLPMLVDGVRGRVAIGRAFGEADHPQAEQLINRVGVWRGAGNAIVPQEAEQVVRAYMEAAA